MHNFWEGFTKQAFGSGGSASGAGYKRDHIDDRIDAIDEDSYFEGDMRTPQKSSFNISGSVDLDNDIDPGEKAQDRKDFGQAVNAPKSEYNHAGAQ